ncbi:uncharacterized protein LOC123535322 [Mercenaria mercenaria]|uniref:uncharacterized protein LOC123535322 n=1 Tax=Mercenaria mercenaria TaxID=6596 RepID=UPI00234F4B29|nr:uncharacterized protein LOC123535322 [Mercenaria mercenaria]
MSSNEQVDGKKKTDNKNATTVSEERRCSVCTKKNLANCAEKYCIECNDFYCNVCVTLHEEIPALSNHQLIEKKDFTTRSGRLLLPSIPTERCRTHRTNTVDMYCIDHDTVGCHTCLSLGHGYCKKLYIPENIGQLSQASGDKAEIVKQEAIELRERLLLAFKRRETDKKSVQTKYENAKHSIKKFRREMKKKLKELEVSTVAVLDSECDIFVQKLDEEIKSLSHFVRKLDDNIGNLKISSESNNASQLFVALQILSKDISETKSVYKTMSTQVVKSIDFIPDKSLTKSIQCLENLGTIDYNSIDKPAPLWEIKSAEDISVRTEEDSKDCSIRSACITRLGHILLVDSNNSNIKLLDRAAQKVVDTCTLETTAWSVCTLEGTKSIVSLPRAKRVRIIEADGQIKPTGFIHIGYECFAIAYSMKELYVSDEHGSVIVHSISGDILRRYSKDQNGKDLFSDVWALAVNKPGDRIYVADKDNGVIAINKDGALLWAFEDTTCSDATGICLDEMFHNVLVLGYASDNVTQIGQTGKKVGQVVKQINGLNYPTAMCYEWKSDTLIIANNFGSNLRVFQLK